MQQPHDLLMRHEANFSVSIDPAWGLLVDRRDRVWQTTKGNQKNMPVSLIRSGSRCSDPGLPSIPISFPPSYADGRELGDTGCRGAKDDEALGGGRLLDFVTVPLDRRGSDRSFRC